MIEVVQVFDRERIAELPTDDASALETKLATARARFQDRAAWLQPHERIAVLHKLAGLVEKRSEAFATLIAREGGKPYSDALVETDRAIDGIRNAADLLRTRAGVEVPMGLTPASENRRAWTVKEPIGVVAAISAFNHPLNLIVHQVAPAIATGCPVVVKPAMATPLCCLELVKLVHEAGMPDGWVQTLLPESRDLSKAFATDTRVAFLSFIGSAKVGWRCARSWRPEPVVRSNMAASHPLLSIGAPISTRSSSQSSKAATTTPARFACQSSASMCMPSSSRPSSTA
jgi:acyl-CoA reductase-like NAD-dependent aldehyde dehydrogenase